MLKSMTAFASAQGQDGRFVWTWELRGVNGKGLDLRLRVPEWIEGLEPMLRADLAAALGRGNVTLTLRVQSAAGAAVPRLDEQFLDQVLTALAVIETRAQQQGLTMGPTSAADLLALRGMFEPGEDVPDGAALARGLRADFAAVLNGFVEMRIAEGRALKQVLEARIDRIAGLVEAAAEVARDRRPEAEASFRAALARVVDAAPDEARLSQELALLAVRADVTEEIDRLRAHVGAARDLLAARGPVGRKLDFLAQEFNRETNTLCSKSQHSGLTEIGLELKLSIDQMREQVQNVE